MFPSTVLEHVVQLIEGTPGEGLVPYRLFLSEIKDPRRTRPQTPSVGAAALAPPLACPTSQEKGPSIVAAQVLLCVVLHLNDVSSTIRSVLQAQNSWRNQNYRQA